MQNIPEKEAVFLGLYNAQKFFTWGRKSKGCFLGRLWITLAKSPGWKKREPRKKSLTLILSWKFAIIEFIIFQSFCHEASILLPLDMLILRVFDEIITRSFFQKFTGFVPQKNFHPSDINVKCQLTKLESRSPRN